MPDVNSGTTVAPYHREEEIPEERPAQNEIEEVLFELHDNWFKYRGHAVPMNLVWLVKELRDARR